MPDKFELGDQVVLLHKGRRTLYTGRVVRIRDDGWVEVEDEQRNKMLKPAESWARYREGV